MPRCYVTETHSSWCAVIVRSCSWLYNIPQSLCHNSPLLLLRTWFLLVMVISGFCCYGQCCPQSPCEPVSPGVLGVSPRGPVICSDTPHPRHGMGAAPRAQGVARVVGGALGLAGTVPRGAQGFSTWSLHLASPNTAVSSFMQLPRAPERVLPETPWKHEASMADPTSARPSHLVLLVK